MTKIINSTNKLQGKNCLITIKTLIGLICLLAEQLMTGLNILKTLVTMLKMNTKNH